MHISNTNSWHLANLGAQLKMRVSKFLSEVWIEKANQKYYGHL